MFSISEYHSTNEYSIFRFPNITQQVNIIVCPISEYHSKMNIIFQFPDITRKMNIHFSISGYHSNIKYPFPDITQKMNIHCLRPQAMNTFIFNSWISLKNEYAFWPLKNDMFIL